MSSPRDHRDIDLNIPGIETTALWDELISIKIGQPWTEAPIAGLQYYDYAQPGLSGEPISPALGDRLVLVRAPNNANDCNAVEVWWRNSIRLGHLPRELAAEVAPRLDAGELARAYVTSTGNGEPWSAWILLVGEAVRTAYDRHRAEYRPPSMPALGDLDDDIPF
ncbi:MULTISPECIES: HIRAN domain-containing protein [Methylobacterium]|uniref:HIRAN domain-containing protein n=1 Tax=Methylobacterium aquaticum TaxID=270351 RepID=A0A0C6FQK9_9HYPH|nr:MULTISPECIES: HIRAN domain-containing protein [Methylobacterium]NGM37137.1 hypothetical protein [Methylobacterium sp. DB0501]BAQ47584.1 hypothetical protein Maq22A_c23100 [Methylobacterium aquaticum]